MRALCFLILISLLTPLKGWGFTVFFKDRSSAGRSVFACMVDQLTHGVELHEKTPIDEAYFVSPQLLGVRSPSLFVQAEKGGNSVLNPAHYDALFTKLQNVFDRHDKGFLAATNLEEAERIVQYLEKRVPQKKFALLHPGLRKEERESIQALYEQGKINFLVAAKALEDLDHFPGMSLYVDLNREVHDPSFLRGVSHVLSAEHGKKEADIISLMELNKESVLGHVAGLDRSLEANKSNQTRADLLNLRSEMQKVGHPVLSSIDKTVDDLIVYIYRHGAVPRSKDDYALYQRVLRYQRRPAFDERLKKNPEAWNVFQNSTIRKNMSTAVGMTVAEKAAVEIIDHILLHKEVPLWGTPLYRSFIKHRDDPSFVAKIKEVPEAWEIYHKWLTQGRGPTTATLMAAENAATDIITHLLTYRELPPRNSALSAKLYRYRDDPKFITKLKENPEAWEIYKNKTRGTKIAVEAEAPPIMTPAEDAAVELIPYLLEKKARPPLRSPLYRKFMPHRNDPKFIAKLKEIPEAWEIYENLPKRKKRTSWKAVKTSDNMTVFMTSPQRAATDLIAYISENGELPPKGSGLYQRYVQYRDNKEFITKAKQTPAMWEKYLDLRAGVKPRRVKGSP